jgi:hypothetical protein
MLDRDQQNPAARAGRTAAQAVHLERERKIAALETYTKSL